MVLANPTKTSLLDQLGLRTATETFSTLTIPAGMVTRSILSRSPTWRATPSPFASQVATSPATSASRRAVSTGPVPRLARPHNCELNLARSVSLLLRATGTSTVRGSNGIVDEEVLCHDGTFMVQSELSRNLSNQPSSIKTRTVGSTSLDSIQNTWMYNFTFCSLFN